MSRHTVFEIFDTIIQPVLLYAAEVWGMLVDYDPTEKVHLFACKSFLNVAELAPNRMVYDELGRHPLKINCFIRALRFWFRLFHMDEIASRQFYDILECLTYDNSATFYLEYVW